MMSYHNSIKELIYYKRIKFIYGNPKIYNKYLRLLQHQGLRRLLQMIIGDGFGKMKFRVLNH